MQIKTTVSTTYTYENGPEKKTITSAGDDVEELEPSHIVGGAEKR